jgi:hypothetical protein
VSFCPGRIELYHLKISLFFRAHHTSNKNGVSITSEHDTNDGVVCVKAFKNQPLEASLTIKNENKEGVVEFNERNQLYKCRIFEFKPFKKITLQPGMFV